MIKLTKELLAIRAKHIIEYDRDLVDQAPKVEPKANPLPSKLNPDSTISVVKYLKRLCL